VKRFIIILITLIMMTFSLIYAAEQPFVLPVNMGSDVIHNPAGRGFLYEGSLKSEISPIDPNNELLIVDIINIGTGDAIFLRCGNENMLIDGGVRGKAKTLEKYFQNNGITNIHYFFNTHPHDDHIQAQEALIRKSILPGEYLSMFHKEYGNEDHQNLVNQVNKHNVPYLQVKNGDFMTLGNAKLTFFNDDRGIPNTSLNGRSMMLNVKFGNSSILFTADVTGENLAYLCQKYPELANVDILKSPHHGINRLRSEVYESISPQMVVITSTKKTGDNLASQLRNRKIPHYFISMGTVRLETDGTVWYVTQLINE
jgi:beta-lactamase superfamily II metal-dependent hydrolase